MLNKLLLVSFVEGGLNFLNKFSSALFNVPHLCASHVVCNSTVAFTLFGVTNACILDTIKSKFDHERDIIDLNTNFYMKDYFLSSVNPLTGSLTDKSCRNKPLINSIKGMMTEFKLFYKNNL